MRNRTGAIGGLLAAKLAHAGERMSVITRDAHLASTVGIGLCFIEGGQKIVPHCGERPYSRRWANGI